MFRFVPGKRTLTAVMLLVLLWVAVALVTVLSQDLSGLPGIVAGVLRVIRFALWFITGHIFLSVFLPVAFATKEEGSTLADFGITRKRWLPSVLLSAVFAAVLLVIIGPVPRDTQGGTAGVLISGALSLWLPFFVHGFLQPRLEAAFGWLPGVILAGAAVPLLFLLVVNITGLVFLLASGVAAAALFGLTRNVLAVWPLPYAIIAGLATAPLAEFSVERAIVLALVLLAQVYAMGWVPQRARPYPQVEGSAVP